MISGRRRKERKRKPFHLRNVGRRGSLLCGSEDVYQSAQHLEQI